MQPRVSILIAAYNSERYLESSVRSVLEQSMPEIEVIIVDDGSTDGTAELCRALAAQDTRVRWQARAHAGISATRNGALRLASGEYVSVIDSDDRWHREKLAMQLESIGNATNAIVLCDTLRFTGGEGEGSVEWLNSSSPPEWRTRSEYCRELLSLPANRMQSFHTFLMLRNWLVEMGGWNESFASAEDWELWCRTAMRFTIRRVPEQLYFYRKHAGSVSRTAPPVRALDAQLRVAAWFAGALGLDARYECARRRLQFADETAAGVPRRWLLSQVAQAAAASPKLLFDARFRRALRKAFLPDGPVSGASHRAS